MKITTLLLSLSFLYSFHTVVSAQSSPCITSVSIDVDVQVCSAIQEIVGLNNLTIAPNPSTGHFELSFAMNTKTDLRIQLLDPLKKTLYQEDKSYNGFTSKHIEVSNLAAGIYFLVIRSEEGVLSRKVVVQ